MSDAPAGRPVLATYRLQLGPGFGFAEAAAVVPHLAGLGASHLYLSPIMQAAEGSTHGYDVVDQRHVSAALGGLEGFWALADTAHAAGLGLVVDVVPHHMAVGGRENPWWWDVLTFGPSSRYASHFDIDWQHPEARLRDRVVLPVLGDHYGRELERGAIRVVPDDEDVAVILVYETPVPLSPASVGRLVEEAATLAGDDELGLLGRALCRVTSGSASTVDEREQVVADTRAAYRRITGRRATDPAVAAALDEVIAAVDGDRERLHDLLEHQHHRLVRWKVSASELGYRRFFDVNTLAAMRTERPEVFRDTHDAVLALVREGAVDGLRVDHIDGLLDPEGYTNRLREAAPDAWIVVEKILAAEERLRTEWPVDGTTGYEFAALLTPMLVDPRGEEPLTIAYESFAGDARPWAEVAEDAKREVLTSLLGGDLERLTELFVHVCERRPRFRDFTRGELRAALVEVAVHLPVYRVYVTGLEDEQPRLADGDKAVLAGAVAAARAGAPHLDGEVFDLLSVVLTFSAAGEAERELALRFQQLTGPATAKGEEDTALYRFGRLLALDDVGHDPSRFSAHPDDLHRWAKAQAEHHPASMLTTSTHDTKRSEDVRARLAVLPELGSRWGDLVWRWHERTRDLRPAEVDRATEWFTYQTLVGAWPIGPERLWPVLEKSFREAKVRTSWARPDTGFEEAARGWVDALLADDGFTDELGAAAAELRVPGWRNSLAQVALRLTAPGVPDTYRGTELWDLSLVDPDNRRPVDWTVRTDLAARIEGQTVAACWAAATGGEGEVRTADGELGAPKLALLRDLGRLRRERPEALAPGAPYAPLDVSGPEPVAALGFVRGVPASPGGAVVTVVARFPLAGAALHAATEVTLPEPGPGRRWVDVLSGTTHEAGTVPVPALVGDLPVAVLVDV